MLRYAQLHQDDGCVCWFQTKPSLWNSEHFPLTEAAILEMRSYLYLQLLPPSPSILSCMEIVRRVCHIISTWSKKQSLSSNLAALWEIFHTVAGWSTSFWCWAWLQTSRTSNEHVVQHDRTRVPLFCLVFFVFPSQDFLFTHRTRRYWLALCTKCPPHETNLSLFFCLSFFRVLCQHNNTAEQSNTEATTDSTRWPMSWRSAYN